MLTASWRDMEIAGIQGTITTVTIPGMGGSASIIKGSRGLAERNADVAAATVSWIVLIVSAALLGTSFYRYRRVKADAQEEGLREPLTPSGEEVLSTDPEMS